MPDMRSSIDARVERLARDMAQRVSRRSFIRSIGALMFGAASVPLLPVARGESPAPASPGTGADPGDPQSCEYWRHCAIDGFLCACCGGSAHSCPPGTEPSAITWVGTCNNPARSEEHTSELQSPCNIVCRLLLAKKQS